MSPMLLAQLNRLRNNIRSLAEREQQLRRELTEQAGENDRLTKTLFRHEREKQTLRMNEQAYDDLKARHDSLLEVNAELGERAARLSAMAAALVESLEK